MTGAEGFAAGFGGFTTHEAWKSGGVSKYVQLSAMLRDRIARGHWRLGEQLPTVAALAREYGMALVTVRQALHLLVEEGLVTSRQGRGTFVSRMPERPGADLRAAINHPLASVKSLQIRVLSTQRGVRPPQELLAGHRPFVDYVLLRKMHLHAGEPFCFMELYVAAEVFDRLPPGSVQVRRINSLLLDLMPHDLDGFHTAMTLAPADDEVARRLDYPFAAPVARVVRVVRDKQGRAVYAGLFWYRGDRFALEVDVPATAMLQQPTLLAPIPQDRD